MTQMYEKVEDEYLQKNVEQTGAQFTGKNGANQTDSQKELKSCAPTLNQTSEESRKEHASVETGLTCSCKSASQSNLPDVIQTDYKENDIAKNDNTVWIVSENLGDRLIAINFLCEILAECCLVKKDRRGKFSHKDWMPTWKMCFLEWHQVLPLEEKGREFQKEVSEAWWIVLCWYIRKAFEF